MCLMSLRGVALQVTLINWGNMRVKHVKTEKDDTVSAISFDADLDNKVVCRVLLSEFLSSRRTTRRH